MKRHSFVRRTAPRGKRTRANQNGDNSEDEPSANEILKQLMVEKLDKMVKCYFDDKGDKFNDSRKMNLRAENIIPAFNPEDRNYTIKSWLSKIDQLGEIHRWNEYSKSFLMQGKLEGHARDWFNRLDRYDYSWEEWKALLLRAFPRSYDYADMLEELVARKKCATESMTKYYHDKLSLCNRCSLSDDASISCLIRGLPEELRANARAFQCSKAHDLYVGFLAPLDNYQSVTKATSFIAGAETKK